MGSWGGEVGTAGFGCGMWHPGGAPKCGNLWDPHTGQGKLRVWIMKRRRRRRKMKDPHQTVPGPESGFVREGGGTRDTVWGGS